MEKTHFNDTRPYKNDWIINCPSCRCTINLHVVNYPHGPQDVIQCPVCGDKETNIEHIGTPTQTTT